MKKNIIISALLILFTTITANAQEQKEYNMVITLQNGTTITLGHNDIKNISFNDGEISISGNIVNTIDSICNVTKDHEMFAEDIKRFAEDIQMRIYDIYERTQYQEYMMLEQKDEIEDKLASVETLLKTEIDEIYEYTRKDIEGRLNEIYTYLTMLSDEINKLKNN